MDRAQIQECQKPNKGCYSYGDERAAFSVYIGEDLWGLALFGQRGESACCAVHGRICDGEDGNHYYCVHNAVEAGDAGGLDGDYEGRGFGLNVISVNQLRIVVWDE